MANISKTPRHSGTRQDRTQLEKRAAKSNIPTQQGSHDKGKTQGGQGQGNKKK